MIRLATEADLAGIVVLETELFGPDSWDETALHAELVGPGRRFVVAGTEHLSGYAVSRSIGDVVDLQRIGVSAHRRRAGLATALLEDLLAHPGGAARMMLEVSAANRTAVAFYQRRGFSQIDVRPRYYRDGSDAWVMSRAIVMAERGSGRMER